MKVLMLNGSPHERGCTNRALIEVGRALNKEGIDTEYFHVGGQTIHGCIACQKCAQTGRCVFTYDMVNQVLDEMETASGIVVGSPVHYASPNGTIISFLDRLFYAGRNFAFKPAAAVVSARRAGTTASIDVLNKYFTIAQMPVVSSSYWNMVHGFTAQDVEQDLEGLHTMKTLGRNMAWILKCLEVGKAAGIEPPAWEEIPRTNFIR